MAAPNLSDAQANAEVDEVIRAAGLEPRTVKPVVRRVMVLAWFKGRASASTVVHLREAK